MILPCIATMRRTDQRPSPFVRNPLASSPHPINNTVTRLYRLEKQMPLKQFRTAKGDYIQLGVYVHELFCHLAYPEMEVSLPLKPSLALVRK